MNVVSVTKSSEVEAVLILAEIIRKRLEVLGHEQRDLAVAARVTESYISQLLTGKKSLPAPHRSDIYEKIEGFLNLSAGEWEARSLN